MVILFLREKDENLSYLIFDDLLNGHQILSIQILNIISYMESNTSATRSEASSYRSFDMFNLE
jgi:hypothetical protein